MRRVSAAGPHAGRLVTKGAPRVFVRAKRIPGLAAAALRRAVFHTLERAAPDVVGDVGVVIVDDATMRRLNRRYRALDAATDVLAFPLGDGRERGLPFGDVVISHETARRQAREYGARLADEMKRLLVHGTLHLCGYDHHERRQAARMHGLTRRLLRELKSRD